MKLGKTPAEFLESVSSSEVSELMAYFILQEREGGQPASKKDVVPEDLDAKSRSFFGRH